MIKQNVKCLWHYIYLVISAVGQDCSVSGASCEPVWLSTVLAGIQHQTRPRRRPIHRAERRDGHQEQEQDSSQAAQGRLGQLEGGCLHMRQVWLYSFDKITVTHYVVKHFQLKLTRKQPFELRRKIMMFDCERFNLTAWRILEFLIINIRVS